MGIREGLIQAAGETAGRIMQGLDGLFTSDDERNASRLSIENALNSQTETILSHIEAQDAERTSRHHADMNSDSWMSKSIRPLTLAYLTAMFTIFVFADSSAPACTVTSVAWCFSVSDVWIDLFKLLLTSVYGFYFLSRGIEKITQSVAQMRQASQVTLR